MDLILFAMEAYASRNPTFRVRLYDLLYWSDCAQ